MNRLFPSPGDVDPVDDYGRLSRAGDRPRVRLNMIASVDGAASLAGRSGALGGPPDKALFATLRSLADVIVAGDDGVDLTGAVPLLVGGDAGRILDGDPLKPPQRLELHHVLEADGYLFLRYRPQ